MRAELAAVARRRSRPSRAREAVALEERAVVVAGEEARLLALGAAARRRARRAAASARVSVLRLLAEREPDPVEQRRVERARACSDWSFAGSRRAREQEAPVALDDARVVAGREPGGAGAPREREQLAEAEAAVAARCTGSASRRARSRARTASTTARRNSSRRSSVTCGSPSAWQVARAGEHRARASSTRARRPGPSGSSQRRSVTPTACGPGAQQRDGAVDAAAHRDRDARRVGRGAEDRAERVRERVDRERLAADRRRLEQRQPARASRVEPGRVRLDDPVAVDAQPDERPARRRARSLRRPRSSRQATVERRRAPGAPVVPHPAVVSRPMRTWRARWVPCGPSTRYAPRPDAGSLSYGVGSTLRREHTHGVEHARHCSRARLRSRRSASASCCDAVAAPSFAARAPRVRSNSRPGTYGPRSITCVSTVLPPKREEELRAAREHGVRDAERVRREDLPAGGRACRSARRARTPASAVYQPPGTGPAAAARAPSTAAVVGATASATTTARSATAASANSRWARRGLTGAQRSGRRTTRGRGRRSPRGSFAVGVGELAQVHEQEARTPRRARRPRPTRSRASRSSSQTFQRRADGRAPAAAAGRAGGPGLRCGLRPAGRGLGCGMRLRSHDGGELRLADGLGLGARRRALAPAPARRVCSRGTASRPAPRAAARARSGCRTSRTRAPPRPASPRRPRPLLPGLRAPAGERRDEAGEAAPALRRERAPPPGVAAPSAAGPRAHLPGGGSERPAAPGRRALEQRRQHPGEQHEHHDPDLVHLEGPGNRGDAEDERDLDEEPQPADPHDHSGASSSAASGAGRRSSARARGGRAQRRARRGSATTAGLRSELLRPGLGGGGGAGSRSARRIDARRSSAAEAARRRPAMRRAPAPGSAPGRATRSTRSAATSAHATAITTTIVRVEQVGEARPRPPSSDEEGRLESESGAESAGIGSERSSSRSVGLALGARPRAAAAPGSARRRAGSCRLGLAPRARAPAAGSGSADGGSTACGSATGGSGSRAARSRAARGAPACLGGAARAGRPAGVERVDSIEASAASMIARHTCCICSGPEAGGGEQLLGALLRPAR